MRLFICGLILCAVTGCCTPDKVVIVDMNAGMGLGGMDGSPPREMIREEWKCPKCGKQYKTKYLAQKCIDAHD